MAVVGGGFAGLTAANRAAQRGFRVVVLECGPAPDYACNSRVCTGVYHVAWMPESCDSELLYDRIMSRSGGGAKRDLARLLATMAAPVKAWLLEQGAAFQPHYRDPGGPESLAPRRRLGPGLDWRDRGPDRLLQRMTKNLAARGGEIHLGTRAESLMLDNGACVGLNARRSGKPTRYRAPAVVLADGGFQAAPDLVSKYVTAADGIQQRNTGTGRGDGLRMAEAAGAALVGLEGFYGHVLSRDAFTNDRLWPYPQLDVLAASNILIDGSGRRFADEGLGGVYMSNAIARLADPLSACIVFDWNAWQAARTEDTVPPNPSLVDAGGTLLRGDSIAGLAERIGVPRAALQATVSEYNEALGKGELARLRPPRRTGTYVSRPIRTAPFFAAPVCAGITVTTGGIAVDGQARVLRDDQTPIPGLFAAGSTAGGMEGGPGASYVGGLSKAFVLGYRAAETIGLPSTQRAWRHDRPRQ